MTQQPQVVVPGWVEQLPWAELQAVGIRTSGDGPFVEDMFWQFLLRDRLVELPNGEMTGDALSAIGARLPGFDYARVIAASGSTEDRWFSVWDREVSAPLDAAGLRARFVALIGRLGGDAAAADELGAQLLARWSGDKARRYHNAVHLAACLHELDAARDRGDAGATDADRIELALWYHDAIYAPGAVDNEARSAALLVDDAAALALDGDTARAAAALVMATAHDTEPAAGNAAPSTDLMIDIDLAILGAASLRFLDYDYSIEEEYATVPTRTFRVARGRFLAGMLARPRLFRTAAFHARYEARARGSITGLLASPRYRAYRWLRWLPV